MCILHSYYYSCRHHKRDIFDCKKHRKHPNRRLYCSKPVQEAERLGRWCPRCQNGEMSPNDPDEEDEHGTDSEWEGASSLLLNLSFSQTTRN
ncbi:hypothetical protein KEM55_000147 [Ascosphaera atra]|nr:hypothetical protein KEM55_000147 [Ascosphaera atra]